MKNFTLTVAASIAHVASATVEQELADIFKDWATLHQKMLSCMTEGSFWKIHKTLKPTSRQSRNALVMELIPMETFPLKQDSPWFCLGLLVGSQTATSNLAKSGFGFCPSAVVKKNLSTITDNSKSIEPAPGNLVVRQGQAQSQNATRHRKKRQSFSSFHVVDDLEL